MAELPEILANHSGIGYVIAPAGFGKTHLIAESIKHTRKRQLILTHTHAGVDSLKKKLQKLNIPVGNYKVDTIASFALRYCLAYPKTAIWTVELPTREQWQQLYPACGALLTNEFIKEILKTSYGGIYVDEYQDCTVEQHEMLLILGKIMSVRVLGDPLQAIFDNIGGQKSVNWDKQIMPHFEKLGELQTPHRWINSGNPELGDWIARVRAQTLNGESIDLTDKRPSSVKVKIAESDDDLRNKQFSTCRWYSLPSGEKVMAIHKGDQEYKAKCHKLAKQTGGFFSSIEEVEAHRLFKFIDDYESQYGVKDKLLEIIKFLKDKCFSGINLALAAGIKRGEKVNVTAKTKNPSLVLSANNFLSEPTPKKFMDFLKSVKDTDGVVLHARDLYNRLMNVLKDNMANPNLNLEEAANEYQRRFRHIGRPLAYPKLIGTTLLVKGQEYDHAIILDATSLNKKDFYVALTRGSKSITIITKSAILNPAD